MTRFVSALCVAVLVFSSSAAASARPNLKITVVNDSDRTLDVVAFVGGTTGKPLSVGRINGKDRVENSLPLRNGQDLLIVASLPNSAVVDRQNIEIHGDAEKTVHVGVRDAEVLPANAADQLVSDLAKIGPAGTIPALTLEAAVANVLGALVLFDDKADAAASPLYTIAPSSLGTNADINTLSYGSFTDAASVKITPSLSPGVQATIPTLSSIGLKLDDDALYQLDYQLSQAGAISPDATVAKSPAQAFTSISPDDKKAMCAAAAGAKDPRILYITTLYGFKTASFAKQQALKVPAGPSLGGNLLLARDGAYTFGKSETELSTFGPTVVNVTGVAFSSAVLCAVPSTESIVVTTTSTRPSKNNGKADGGITTTTTIARKISVAERLERAQHAALVVPASALKMLLKNASDPYAKPQVTMRSSP